jgi:hypothetical protein
MAQATNPSIATGQTGTAYRTQDNDRYAAGLTTHSGASRPSYAVAGTLWLDTSGTPWILKIYDGADDVSIGTVNATTNQFGASNAASTGSTIAMTAAINEAGATVASAPTCDIGAAAGNYVSITGTTTITALGTVQTGTRRTVRFAGILTLTHDGTSLILPGAENIDTAAGDVAVFVSLGSGNWVCAGYVRAASKVSTLTAGTSANNLVQLDGSGKLPAVDGSLLTGISGGGTQDSFSAAATSQTVANATFTKVQFDVENWDTASKYDNTTNYRYTPAAGKYLLMFGVAYGSLSDQKRTMLELRKNGSALHRVNGTTSGSGNEAHSNGSVIVDANGTDYYEVFTYHTEGTATTTYVTNGASWFKGVRVA